MNHATKRRRQFRQSPIRSVTSTYSYRYGKASIFDSKLEWDYWLWRHYCFDFQTLEMQPAKVEYRRSCGTVGYYTADASYIDENGERHFDEIKMLQTALKPAVMDKHQRIRQAIEATGDHFHVITDRDIRVGHRASNLKYLQPCWAMPSPIDEFRALTRQFPHETAKLKDWSLACTSQGLCPSLIRRAAAHKLFKFDIEAYWDNDLILEVSNEGSR